ncbi:inositol monophosphatase family protein [Agrobacterium rubi]|uniref:Inositol monophosphatase n=1 Tax=Agrobacterium rubi TaxID=28099 RepID=A0AAE7UMI8_9HYPH|nr:inositol monophosphatase [Agrobacterium rubi]NTE86249.1 inositol monophosphatase [Agrobacterium rubi]NTF02181.1 inositol monophosphatase [Agrobacterium rubi]NTF36425.1 inositol monophosphatase [Agrobacterium rubi]OCJ44310.1 inositol monophosphatase [Agrobacterium rubi]QTF98898.1 inositol monophosphatase [Agrobacterium rubi]
MTLSDTDLDFLISTVADAGVNEIMPRFRNLSASDISQKTSVVDLVTEADVLAEKRITAALLSRFPKAHIVGEEAYDADHSVIPALTSADLAFVIDPIDGTFNYASGFPAFGTLLAVTVKGETVAGIIHDPVMGDTIVAVKGAGATLKRKNGSDAKLRVAQSVSLSEMVGIFSWGHSFEERRPVIAANMTKAKMALSLNCSAHEYWLVTTGKLHFIGHEKLMPWDHLAGVLTHQEAGGYTAKFDGTPYRPGDLTGGILSAPDKDSWKMLRREIVGL